MAAEKFLTESICKCGGRKINFLYLELSFSYAEKGTNKFGFYRYQLSGVGKDMSSVLIFRMVFVQDKS
jgi:hypothetical protein